MSPATVNAYYDPHKNGMGNTRMHLIRKHLYMPFADTPSTCQCCHDKSKSQYTSSSVYFATEGKHFQ